MPMLTVVTVAAKAADGPSGFRKRGVAKGCTCGEGQAEQVTQHGLTWCHTTRTQFKAGGSRGSHSLRPWLDPEEDPAPCPAGEPDPDSDPCIPESSSHLLWCPVQGVLVPAPVARNAPNSESVLCILPYFS